MRGEDTFIRVREKRMKIERDLKGEEEEVMEMRGDTREHGEKERNFGRIKLNSTGGSAMCD